MCLLKGIYIIRMNVIKIRKYIYLKLIFRFVFYIEMLDVYVCE